MPGGDRVPALDRHEDAAAAADVRADVRLAQARRRRRRGSRPCGARRRTRRARSPGTRRRRRSSAMPRVVAAPRVAAIQLSSLPVSCARRTNFVMPAPITATRFGHQPAPPAAPRRRRCVLGTPRQDWATAVVASPARSCSTHAERAREAVRLVQVALAQRAARAVHAGRVEAGEAERVEVLQLLVRERVVDLGQRRRPPAVEPGPRVRALGRARGRRRAVPVAALQRRRVLVPADAVDPDRVGRPPAPRRPAPSRRSRRRCRAVWPAVSGLEQRIVGARRRLGVGGATVRRPRAARLRDRHRGAVVGRSARSRAGSAASRGPRRASAGTPSGRFSTGSKRERGRPCRARRRRRPSSAPRPRRRRRSRCGSASRRSPARTGRRATTVCTGRCTAPSWSGTYSSKMLVPSSKSSEAHTNESTSVRGFTPASA